MWAEHYKHTERTDSHSSRTNLLCVLKFSPNIKCKHTHTDTDTHAQFRRTYKLYRYLFAITDIVSVAVDAYCQCK